MMQKMAAQVDKGWSNGLAHIMPTGQFWAQTTNVPYQHTPSQTYTSANLGLTTAV